MSIACLGLLSSINAQGINLESPGAQLGGTYSNISQSNDAIEGLGIPNATWVQGVAPSTDPGIPNAFVVSVATNSPVSPTVDTIVMIPTGGGSNGNGTITLTGGDLSVGGDAVLQNIVSATSLATDANGKIIAGAPVNPNYQGKLASGTIQSGLLTTTPANPYFGDITDQSLMSIDYQSRVCTVQIFFNAKTTGTPIPVQLTLNPAQSGGVFGLEVFPQPSAGQLPFPSPDGATQNVFQGFYVNEQNQANNVPILFNWVYNQPFGQIFINLATATPISPNSGDTIFFIGTLSYIF